MADLGLSTIIAIASTAVSAAGTLAAGAAAKTSADYQAAQIEAAGKEEKAASQREADRVKRERDFILSRQQAVASSGNLGALDETVLDLAGDVVQESAVQEGMVRYGGEERVKGRRAQAAAARLEGKAAQTGSYFAAAGTLMDGVGSFSKDWAKAKKPASTASYMYA